MREESLNSAINRFGECTLEVCLQTPFMAKTYAKGSEILMKFYSRVVGMHMCCGGQAPVAAAASMAPKGGAHAISLTPLEEISFCICWRYLIKSWVSSIRNLPDDWRWTWRCSKGSSKEDCNCQCIDLHLDVAEVNFNLAFLCGHESFFLFCYIKTSSWSHLK